jgi:Pyruvate/2-oxoacid:ferredoxin oxidoreductase delta subunit
MCEWCTQHGKGKKWYMEVKNYVRKFDEMEDWLKEWNANYRSVQAKLWGPISGELDELKSRLSPRLEKLADNDWEEGFSKYHASQIVTTDEAKEMCDIADQNGGFVKLACTCRKYKRGGKYIGPENVLCLGISAYASMYHEHPERIWKEHKIETVSAEEAKEHLEKCTESGMVHNATYVGSPAYMSKLCNCEYPVCVWLQWRLDWGLTGILKKGHYVAHHDRDKCTGCKECIKVCQFKAISFSPSYGKAILKQDHCFGCAQCLRVCEFDAVKMVERESIPALKEEW